MGSGGEKGAQLVEAGLAVAEFGQGGGNFGMGVDAVEQGVGIVEEGGFGLGLGFVGHVRLGGFVIAPGFQEGGDFGVGGVFQRDLERF